MMLVKDPNGRSEIEALLNHHWCRSARKSDFLDAVKHVQSLEVPLPPFQKKSL